MILALTGATGFVGARTVEVALAAGYRVRGLTRRTQPEREGVTWVPGALDDDAALAELVTGADAVLHVAGVVNAPDRAGFAAGNVDGTRTMLAAAERAGVRRFVHVSSLAAREPGLSMYGWSKAEAERLAAASALDWTIVRPSGVYGPGDMEMRDLFRLARFGLALTPPPGRFSVVEVGDLARLLVALAAHDPGRMVLEVDDGGDGWSHRRFARAVGAAVGRRVVTVALPRPLLALVARLDRLARGNGAKLTPDRAAYLAHPDWTIDPARRPSPTLWRPEVPTAEGLAATASWYRAHGLL